MTSVRRSTKTVSSTARPVNRRVGQLFHASATMTKKMEAPTDDAKHLARLVAEARVTVELAAIAGDGFFLLFFKP
jgi:hypothetical protein